MRFSDDLAGGFDYQKNVTLKGNIAIVTGYWGSDRESGIFIDCLGDYYTFDETTGEVCIYNQYGVRGFRQASVDPEAIGFKASREYADKVTKITVGDQVTWPQPEWFRGFDHLKEVDFGDGVPYVSSGYPDYTLGGCTALEKVTIGTNTTYFNFEIFDQCPNLKTVIIKSENLNEDGLDVGRWSAQYHNPDVKIYVPADQVERYKAGMGNYKDQIFPLEALDDPSVLPQPADYMPGDVDLDKHVTAADARLALRRSVGPENYEKGSVKYRACDVDRDGDVSAADARLILRASVGLEDASKWKTY